MPRSGPGRRPAAATAAPPPGEGEAAPEPIFDAAVLPGRSTGRASLAQIRAELGDCTRCKLHASRRSIVFGVGAEDAPLMFVGEAPGEQEDRRGEPFVGPAGELLDKMIVAMGWTARQRLHREHHEVPSAREPQPAARRARARACRSSRPRSPRSRRGSSSRSGARRRTSCSASTRRSARCAARSTIVTA